jgi:hypothetical protein
MISELRTLDKKGRETNSTIRIHRDQMPKAFDALGLPGDFMGGHAGIEGSPTMIYGVKGRRWGLVIGSNDFSHGNWASFHRVKVGDDAWFFAGPDY